MRKTKVKRKENLKSQKAITLIALVITIIVLLILAAVSIATLTGENGILTQAGNAKEQTKVAENEEKSKINNYEEIIDEYTNSERKAMKIVVNSGTDKKIVLPIELNSEDDYVIDWGDGTTSERGDGARTHIYSEANKDYIVTISGTLKQIYSYASETTKSQIKQILQWGETGLTSINLQDCSNLTEIATPTSKSFANITSFSGAFCRTGITSIPENLFANCPNATNFGRTFMGTGITSIPENLFTNCSNATNFNGTFRDTEIKSIPENLFANCSNASNFGATFRGTEIKSIPENLFKNCSRVDDFSTTFRDCKELTNALPLWKSEYYNEGNSNVSETTVGCGCYYGCQLLEENVYIPDYWIINCPEE